jgi:hypothetical protein
MKKKRNKKQKKNDSQSFEIGQCGDSHMQIIIFLQIGQSVLVEAEKP